MSTKIYKQEKTTAGARHTHFTPNTYQRIKPRSYVVKCVEPNCTAPPKYGNLYMKATHCEEHKKFDMLLVKMPKTGIQPLCIFPGCDKIAVNMFNFLNMPLYCNCHMNDPEYRININIQNRMIKNGTRSKRIIFEKLYNVSISDLSKDHTEVLLMYAELNRDKIWNVIKRNNFRVCKPGEEDKITLLDLDVLRRSYFPLWQFDFIYNNIAFMPNRIPILNAGYIQIKTVEQIGEEDIQEQTDATISPEMLQPRRLAPLLPAPPLDADEELFLSLFN